MSRNSSSDHRGGAIRIRSNVSVSRYDAERAKQQPGDIIPPNRRKTKQQKREGAHGKPCSHTCNRNLREMMTDGCDLPICIQNGVPSVAQAQKRKREGLDEG